MLIIHLKTLTDFNSAPTVSNNSAELQEEEVPLISVFKMLYSSINYSFPLIAIDANCTVISFKTSLVISLECFCLISSCPSYQIN